MPVRSRAHSLAASSPWLPRATTWLIFRASIDHFLHFAFRFHPLVGRVELSPQRLVDRSRSPSASSSASFLVLALDFYESVAFFRDVLPCAWAVDGVSFALSPRFSAVVPELVHAVFNVGDQVRHLRLRHQLSALRDCGQSDPRETECDGCQDGSVHVHLLSQRRGSPGRHLGFASCAFAASRRPR